MRRFTLQPWRGWATALCLGLAMAASPAARAQVAGYVFSQTSGTYAPISGGTVVVANTEPNAGGNDSAAMDDFSYAPVTIPFSFTFNGTAYTTLRVVSNGWAYFGAQATTFTTTSPISASDAHTGALSPLGMDLMGPSATTGNTTTGSASITGVGNTANLVIGAFIYGTGIPAGATVTGFTASTITMSANATSTNTGGFLSFTAGEIRVETLGTAPNRTFVVQFKNMALYASSIFSTGNTGFNFQIRLAEGGGVAANQTVTFVYGSFFMLSGSTTAQVGLRGSTNADYNNRTSTTSWSASTAGGSNSASMTLSPTVLPASGQTFSWAPPACLMPTAVTSSAVTTTTATISWTAPSPAPGSGYQYEVRTSGAAGSGATGLVASGSTGAGVTTANVTGLTTATNYFVYVRSNCGSSFSAWTSSYQFATACNAIVTFPYTEGFDGGTLPTCWGTAVVTGTVNWTVVTGNSVDITAPAVGAGFIVKPYNTSTANLYSPPINLASLGATQARINFRMYRHAGTVANDSIRFAINTSASFTGATTLINLKPLTSAAPAEASSGWYNYTANIPVSFNTAGTVYIVMQGVTTAGFSSYDLGLDQFIVEAVPSCNTPTAVVASAVTATTATIGWTAASPAPASGYQYEVRTSGAAGSGPTGLVVSGSTGAGVVTANITGLTAATSYTIYVRSNCGSGFSAWTTGTNFTTTLNCGSATIITACGVSQTATIASGSGAYNPIQLTSGPHIYSTPGKEVLYQYTAPVTGTYTLNVTAAPDAGSFYYVDYFFKAVSGTCSNNGWTFIKDFTNVGTFTFNLTGGTTYFILADAEQTAATSQTFNISCPPTCGTPTALTAATITTTSASLGWTQPALGAPAQWQISYGPVPTTAVNGTKILTTTNPYVLGGLTPATSYNFYVRAICAPGDTSTWSAAGTFNTLCNPSTLPFAEQFSTFLPSVCWSRATGVLPQTGSTTLTTVTSNNWYGDNYLNGSSNPAAAINLYQAIRRDWLVTPTIDLGASGSQVVEFNMGITAYNSTTTGTLGSDDTVAVVISADNGTTWSSANVLRRWTVTNGNVTGQRYYMPINGYTGLVKLGFYGSEGVTDDAPDNEIYFDSLAVVNCVPPVVNLGNDTTLCSGAALTLSSGTGTMYQWSTGATTQSITLNTAGTYYVKTTNGSLGCFRTDTVVISTSTNPVVNLGNDTAFCSGASLVLNAGNTGAAYLWNPGATTAQTRTVTTGGTYSVRVTSPQGCIGRDTIIVTVNPTPVVNLGNDTTFCDGPFLTLNAGNPGASYLWNPGGTTAQTRTVASSGSYSVRVTSAQGCIGRDTINVTVNPIPFVNLGSDTIVCGNVASLVYNAGNPGATYAWSPSLGVMTQTYDIAPLLNNLDLYGAGLGMPTIPVSVAVTRNGCTGYDTVNVTVNFTPRVTGINYTGNSPSFNFTPNADSFATGYLWTFGDNTGAMLTQNASHTYTANGTYTVTLVVQNGCGSDTVMRSVIVTGLGLTRTGITRDMLVLYPNPASQYFTVDDKANLNLLEIQVYNAFGALVIDQPVTGKSARIETSSLANGVYSVRIRTEQGLETRRLEIVR